VSQVIIFTYLLAFIGLLAVILFLNIRRAWKSVPRYNVDETQGTEVTRVFIVSAWGDWDSIQEMIYLPEIPRLASVHPTNPKLYVDKIDACRIGDSNDFIIKVHYDEKRFACPTCNPALTTPTTPMPKN